MPYYSKRIDATLLGHDQQGKPNVVIVELKAWTQAKADDAGNVLTPLGGKLINRPHPSQQVRGYHDHLLDYLRCFQGIEPLLLSSCAYCHNYVANGADDGLFHPQFEKIRLQSPVFGQNDFKTFADYLHERLIGGKGYSVQRVMDSAGTGPSRSLIEHADKVIQQQVVFRLQDDQLATNNSIQAAFRNAFKKKEKRVLVVRGGPGTGKSVIALNTIGEALKQELKNIYLVTGSAAFTYGLRKVLGKRLDGHVKFTDFFWNAAENSADVIVVDEGHRVRDKSTPRVPKEKRPILSQAEELIRAAKVTVIFVDENQIISPDEVGGTEVFRQACIKLGIPLEEHQLKSQFRCDGSDAYLHWLDDLLELDSDPQGLQLKVPEAFNIKLVDSPQVLLDEINAKNKTSPNSARLVAGWCWSWSDPRPGGSVNDIVIGEFQFPWESKNGKKPPKGIPEAKYWAVDPAGADQAGTVYSMQGFEMQHIGVIIGPDLVRRNDSWIAQPGQNFSNGLRRKDPAAAQPYIKRIYRTLLSRAMNSCSVYCVDEGTKVFISSRLL